MTHATCLMATVKDEAPWLLEWVAHNRAIGFDRIVVASNDCSDGTDKMLDRLEEMGVLRHDPNPGPYGNLNVQLTAYQLLRRLPEVANATWLIALDADEYLNIKLGDGGIAALIETLPDWAELVPLVWRGFGDSGLSGWIDGPLCDTLVWAEAAGRRRSHVKSLIRNHHRIQQFGVHVPRHRAEVPMAYRPYFQVADAAGREIPHRIQQFPGAFRNIDPQYHCWDIAQINHYRLKTREMFALKRLRGDAAGAHRAAIRLDTDTAWQTNLNEEIDRSIARSAPARRAELARLLGDPILAQLHEQARASARARVEALLAEADGADEPA